MTNPKIDFSKQVILLDAAFINQSAAGLRRFLSEKLGRTLPPLDLPGWLNYVALDGGLAPEGGNHEIQVIVVHPEGADGLEHCLPADLKEVDGRACRTPLGELAFHSVSPAGITDTEHLYLDLLQIALDSDTIEHLLLLPHESAYGDRVDEALRKASEKKEEACQKGETAKGCRQVMRFVMQQPDSELLYPYDFAGFALMRAWGISADELR